MAMAAIKDLQITGSAQCEGSALVQEESDGNDNDEGDGDSIFKASPWLCPSSKDDDHEGEEGGDDDSGAIDEEDDDEIEEVMAEFPDADRIEIDRLIAQGRVLRQVGYNCYGIDGGSRGDRPALNLRGSSVYSFFLESSLYYYERAFELDLIGRLRRRRRVERIAAATGGRDDADGGRTMSRPSPTPIRQVRMDCIFLNHFGFWDRGGTRLRNMLIGCVNDLPGASKLHLNFSWRSPIPFLRPPNDGRRRVRELRLDDLRLGDDDEMNLLADCFASGAAATATTAARGTAASPIAWVATRNKNNRWDNLTSLAINIVASTTDSPVGLDPIFRAVGGGVGGDHLPKLEIFRLTRKHFLWEDAPCRLNDDDAFVRFLKNRTSIKHVAFVGFLGPKHYGLMGRHLSTHPNIETLELAAADLFDGARGGSAREPRAEEEPAIRDGMRTLVRLVTANPNLKAVGLGHPYRTGPLLNGLLLPFAREIAARTAMNRNGMRRFRDGGMPSPLARPPWGRRDCVDFLVRLRDLGDADLRGRFATPGDDAEGATDNFGDPVPSAREGRSGFLVGPGAAGLVALDALYLALRTRPDLCLLSRAEKWESDIRTLARCTNEMDSLLSLW